MNITDVNTYSENDHLMDLAIEQVGLMTIRVKAGAIKLEGDDTLSLAADEDFVCTNRAEDVQIMAYLVEDRNNPGTLHTLVDEVILDGVDEGYMFGREDQYKLWAYLYKIDIPGGTSDITSLDLIRYRVIAP